jgi:hypothetical protein
MLAALLPAAASSAGAGAGAFTHITAENGVMGYDFAEDQGNGWYSESPGAYRFELGFKQGEGRRGTRSRGDAAEDSFNLPPALEDKATASSRPYLLQQASSARHLSIRRDCPILRPRHRPRR